MSNHQQDASVQKIDSLASVKIRKPSADIDIVPASNFTFAQLTDAYNQTRVDYLVPMPMNERKLIDYVHNYDLDMRMSAVALDGREILGLAMLGVRGDESWVTRLGVVPNGRQRGIGGKLMRRLIENSRQAGIKRMALDVIKNNTPAETLFYKCGFRRVREFYVVRRPPKPINTVTLGIHVEAISPSDVPALLARRTDTPSWLTDTPSMLNAGNVLGLYAELPGGGRGWLAYQSTVFQLGRLVFGIEAGDPVEVATALLEHLHWRHPIQDTAVDNVPTDAPYWPAMKAMGYIVSFNRFEMKFPLA